MATIQDLFKSQKKDLYGKSEAIRIDSRGLINPPRAAALLLSSPTKVGDFIAGQVQGAFGGSANRPSDTIFKGKGFLDKPISLFKTPEALRNAIEPGTDYYLKQKPPYNSFIGTIKQGASSPLGAAVEIGIDLIKGLKDRNPTRGLPYGQKFQPAVEGKDIKITTTFSKFYTKYNGSSDPLIKVVGEVVEREENQKYTWNDANNTILSTEALYDVNPIPGANPIADALASAIGIQQLKKKFELQNQVWVLFKKYGNNEIVPFVGAISGIQESVSPEWTNFRYLGSPFKSYRYLGVERTLNFELKLYYTTVNEKDVTIKKINYLKSLAFPYDQVSQIQYNSNQENPINEPIYSQYAFSPNLFHLSIGDMYRGLFGFISSLQFAVDDTATWPNSNHNMEKDGNNYLYPSVITATIGMTIIEQHPIETDDGITRYKYNFDGLGMDILETQEQKQQKASDKPNSASTTTNNTPETKNTMDVVPVVKHEVKKQRKKKPQPQIKLADAPPKLNLISYQMPIIKDSIGEMERDIRRNIGIKIKPKPFVGFGGGSSGGAGASGTWGVR